MFRERPASANNQTFNSFNNLPRPTREPYISWKGKQHDSDSDSDSDSPTDIHGNKNITYNLNVPTNARPIIPGFDSNTTNNLRRANPIKHWRKQLVPTLGNYSRSAVTVRNAIDAPGANSKQTKTETVSESGNNCLKSNNIKHFLINNMVNDCSNQGLNKKPCDPTTIRRPATTIINTHFDKGKNKRVSSNYHQTHASYLRSRVKLHNQNQTISQINTNNYYVNEEVIQAGKSESLIIKPPTDSTSGSQAFNSVYCADYDCPDGKVIYKPNNRGFSNQGGVSSSLRTLNIQKNAVNKGAVALKDKFGTAVRNNSRYRGLNREPVTTKSFHQVIPGNNICKNVQIVNTQNSGRQPSGGSGNRFVCTDRVGIRPFIPSLNGDTLARSQSS
tara:strand:+ start:18082 stop:19245 length:1164 start_codon:yes stop_codon:yes gene_type:complete